jgi:hypothetical protein
MGINLETAEKHEGVVSFIVDREGKFFGFIQPAWINPNSWSHETAVWFSRGALDGLTVQQGECVRYVLYPRNPERPTETAFRIFKNQKGE